MKNKKKGINQRRLCLSAVLLLAVCLCFVGCADAPAAARSDGAAGISNESASDQAGGENPLTTDNAPADDTQTVSDPVLAKLRFYIGSEAHTFINDTQELAAAVEELRRDAGAQAATKEIQITVTFASDYFSTEEYKEFAHSRTDQETIEDVHAWREQLNAFSKQYHQGIVEENMPLLAALGYHEATPVEYSPYVVLSVYADRLDAQSLYQCASQANVVGIYVGEENRYSTMDEANDE
ncbi:MAG: hypothetical protein IJW40_03865 [Clostridia bacterium]|nr:hypothetical protein [Clostridia bacterium]